MALQLSEKDLEGDPDILGSKLMTLCEIIWRKHFYLSVSERDDLISIGLLKALESINSGKWDKNKGNFATFIYSGIRNSMHNYLYHENKFNKVDIDEMTESGEDDEYFHEEVIQISYPLIHSICLNFVRPFGDNIELSVIKHLEEIGYEIKGRKDKSSEILYYSNAVNCTYGDDAEDDIVGRLIGLILWRKQEQEIKERISH